MNGLGATLRPPGAPAAGDVYRWDLDKTYLRTRFDTPGELLRTAFERAERKENVPGTGSLLRELAIRPDGLPNHIDVISGSPTLMRRALLAKFRLDGVRVDRLFLKPMIRRLLRGGFKSLQGQVGYKLPILLRTRAAFGPERQEFCFGDDSESDALIYSLYADLCAGRRPDNLTSLLEANGVSPEEIDAIEASLPGLPKRHVVRRIFINLARDTPAESFAAFGGRVIPSKNTFQTALVLYQHGRLSPAGVARIATEMVERHGIRIGGLAESFEETMRAGWLLPEHIEPLRDALYQDPPLLMRLDPDRLVRTFLDRAVHVAFPAGARYDPDDPEVIDYADCMTR